MNNINIIFIIIIISLVVLYVNDINNKLDVLDDKEHLSDTPKKKVFSGKQIAIIAVVSILVIAIPTGIFLLWSMKHSVVPLEQ